MSGADGECRDSRPNDMLLPPRKRIGKQRARFPRLQNQFPEIGDAGRERRTCERGVRLRAQGFGIGQRPNQRERAGKGPSPTLDPPLGLIVAHRLPPAVPGRDQRLLARNCERKRGLLAGRNQLGHWLAMAGDDHRLASLHQFQETGKLGLGLMYVHLHSPSLVHMLS